MPCPRMMKQRFIEQYGSRGEKVYWATLKKRGRI